MSDWVQCDSCEAEGPVDDMVLIQQHRGADYYRCMACNEKRGEYIDGALWAQVDIQRMADND